MTVQRLFRVVRAFRGLLARSQNQTPGLEEKLRVRWRLLRFAPNDGMGVNLIIL